MLYVICKSYLLGVSASHTHIHMYLTVSSGYVMTRETQGFWEPQTSLTGSQMSKPTQHDMRLTCI